MKTAAVLTGLLAALATDAKNKSISMIHQYRKTTAMKIHSFLSGQKYLSSSAWTMIAALVLFSTLAVTTRATIKIAPDPTNLTFTIDYGDTNTIECTQNFVLAVPPDVSATDYVLVTDKSWLSAADSEGDVSGTIAAGTNKTITVTVLPEGLAIGSYSGKITSGVAWLDVTVNVDIVPKELTLDGLIVNNKEYDGNTTATIASFGTLRGVVGVEDVTLVTNNASAEFRPNANAANDKVVYVSGLALAGAQAGNYSINNIRTLANISRGSQTITFAAIPDQVVAGTVTLSATASSGLTVSYSATGPVVLDGNTLTFTGAGVVSVSASQSGNANWNAAITVTNTFLVAVEGDFNGDGLADPYWPVKSNVMGMWTIWLTPDYASIEPLNTPLSGGDPIRVSDFEGDGLADLVMIDFSTGNWYLWLSSSGFQTPQGPSFSIPGSADFTLAADFDGDRKADPALVIQGNWYIWLSKSGYPTPQVPTLALTIPEPIVEGMDWVAADFDGDRFADPALVVNGNWYFYMSKGGYVQSLPLYMAVSGTDPMPMTGDFDGDGLADPVMVANHNWTFWFSSDGYRPWGPYPFVP